MSKSERLASLYDETSNLEENGEYQKAKTAFLDAATLALEYAKRAYVFKIGEIFLEDKADNLLKNDEVKRSFLGE